MNRRTVARKWTIGALLLLMVTGGVVALAHGYGREESRAPGPATGPLSPEAEAALLAALDAEYAAYAEYAAIIDTYGELEPYATLKEAASHRIELLKRVIERYGGPYPDEKLAPGMVTLPDTLAGAAASLAQAAAERASLYEGALGKLGPHPDIARIFIALERATVRTDLPALELAASSGGALSPDRMARLGLVRAPGPHGGMMAEDEDRCPMEHGMMRWGGREGPRRAMGPMACHGDE